MPEEFIKKIQPLANETYNKYGILPSITSAQAILESDWGRSKLAQQANNYFGIKGTGPAGSIIMNTWEEVGGKKINILDSFRRYNTMQESFDDYGKLLNNSNYTNVKNANDYKSASYALQASGYATDSKYPAKLINIIEENKLYEFDTNKNSNTLPAMLTGNANFEEFDYKAGGAWNPQNWFIFAKDVIYRSAFLVPALVFLIFGIYLLFGDIKTTAIKKMLKG